MIPRCDTACNVTELPRVKAHARGLRWILSIRPTQDKVSHCRYTIGKAGVECAVAAGVCYARSWSSQPPGGLSEPLRQTEVWELVASLRQLWLPGVADGSSAQGGPTCNFMKRQARA